MTGHTKGPWEISEDQGDVVIVSKDRPFVATVHFGFHETTAANARLIAAAPELLSSLSKKVNDAEQACFEEWLESNSPSGDHEEVQRKWRQSSDYKDFFVEWDEQIDAIAKATGEA